MKYKVMFIDEESTQHEDFEDHFEEYWPEAKVICVFPSPTLNEMMEEIEQHQPNAIVVDFQLNDKKTDVDYNVCYNGIELLKEIQAQKFDFPCFVLTSYYDDAVADSDDVNFVYIKKNLHFSSDEGKVSFAQRVKSQIDKYLARIENAKAELSVLLEKRKSGKANVKDEGRIIELDSFLEKTMDATGAIPDEMKHLSNMERLNSLIDKVNQLICKFD